MKYKNIIFDLGDVLVKLDSEACHKAFADLGFDLARLGSDAAMTGLFHDLGLGNISPGQFYAALRDLSNAGVTDSQLRDACNAMLCELPEEKLQRILKLRAEGRRTFLLSNTNDIHWDYCVDNFFRRGGHDENDYFDRIFLSQKMHLEKPGTEIYRKVISEICVDPDETLFIDDRADNCIAAEETGIHSFRNKGFNDWLNIEM